jgi:hypothetical protein
MKIRTLIILPIACLVIAGCPGSHAKRYTHRTEAEKEGLHGAVASIRLDSIIQDKRRLQSTATFDKFGNKVKEVEYDATGKPDHTTIATVDATGNVVNVHAILILPSGPLEQNSSLKYDFGGHPLSITYKGVFGTPDETLKLTLDALGRPVEGIMEGASSDPTMPHKHVFKYDGHGFLTEDAGVDGNGTTWMRDAWQYDNNGMLTKQIHWTFLNGIAYTYSKHKFDKNGSWIRRTVTASVNGKSSTGSRTDIRTITYAK